MNKKELNTNIKTPLDLVANTYVYASLFFGFDKNLRLASRARPLTVDASRAERALATSSTTNQADLSTAKISRKVCSRD